MDGEKLPTSAGDCGVRDVTQVRVTRNGHRNARNGLVT
jgi:hypothetical protein